MNKQFFLLFFLYFVGVISIKADTYPEVIFDNSLTNGSYAKSRVTYWGTSWVENVNKRLLISDSVFFTPGNALSLRYSSSHSGSWKAEIFYSRQKFSYSLSDTDILNLRVFVHSKNTKAIDLPKIYVNQPNYQSDTLELRKYIQNYELGKWMLIKIPVKHFKNLKINTFINGIGFSQNANSNQEHQLFIDQIELLPSKYPDAKLRSPAVLTEAIAYDKMVHLKWQLPLTPSIRYIKIYRALEGQEFKAVALRPIHMQSCLDIVPSTDKKYKYKVAWIDYDYNESPTSEIKSVSTKELKEDEIIDLVQATHLNYFIENFDVNSGMYMPYRSKNKAVVSTQETAGAILSLIIATEKKTLSKHYVLNRISKIVYFLMKAQNIKGIYPAYFDGRKGIPEYRKGNTAIYDVTATSSLIESLLIAREYFDEDTDIEKDLRNRITALYNQINWKELINQSDNEELLHAKFQHISKDGKLNNTGTLLTGIDETINTYLLAIGANDQVKLSPKAYFNAVYYNYQKVKQEITEDELLIDQIYTDSLSKDMEIIQDSTLSDSYESDYLISVRKIKVKNQSTKDTTLKISRLKNTNRYGLDLAFGDFNIDLSELNRTFSTINPAILNDSTVNWKSVLENYFKYNKRRDNEHAIGISNSNIWGYYQRLDSLENYKLNPSMSVAAMIVNPKVGKEALLSLYKQYGQVLISEYGFRAWLDLRNNDISDEYLAKNQATVAIAIENSKNQFIWNLYQKIPELQKARSLLINQNIVDNK